MCISLKKVKWSYEPVQNDHHTGLAGGVILS